ncbi:MAG: cytochrome P450 [Bacteroidota bacterium]
MKTPPHTPLISSWMNIYPNPLNFLLEQQKRYGDIFFLNLGVTKLLVLAHPDHADYVLNQKWRNFDKSGQLYDALRLLAGNGLVGTNDYNYWLQRRRLVQPYFNHNYLPNFTTTMVISIDEILNKIDDEIVDLKEVFGQITMNVIVKTLFGTGIDQTKEDYLRHEASFAFDHMMISMIGSALPLPGRRRFARFVESLDDYIADVIDQRQNEREPVLLDMLINFDDDGNKLSHEDIRNEVLTFFLAGYETTAAALQWSIYYLLKEENSAIKNKMISEIESVIHSKKPEYTDMTHLTLVYNVLSEAMRLRPPGFWVPRRAIVDEKIDGYHISEGTLVAVMIHLIHHHEDFWSDPFTFNPSRFSEASKHKLAFMPFSAGNRKCVGAEFALMEAVLVLTRLFQKFEVSRVDRLIKSKISTTHQTDGIHAKLRRIR